MDYQAYRVVENTDCNAFSVLRFHSFVVVVSCVLTVVHRLIYFAE